MRAEHTQLNDKMAYGLRYQLKFKDIKNNDIRIDFLLQDYTGSTVEQLKGSAGNELTLRRNLGSSGEPEYIDTLEFTIEFIPTESINLNVFRSRSNKKWMIQIFENTTQLYYLWLINTDARQSMNFRRGEPVRLTATDGLGLLKSEYLYREDVRSVWVNPADGDYVYLHAVNQENPPTPEDPTWVEEQVTLKFPYFGEISYMQALFACLGKIGFQIDVAVTCGLTTDWIGQPGWGFYTAETIGSYDPSQHPLTQIKIYASAFEGKSVYDILLTLCKNMNCFISQQGLRWHFWRPNDLYYDGHFSTIFNTYGYPQYGVLARSVVQAGSRTITDKLFFVNDNHDTYYFEPYKSITSNCEYAKPIQLVDNNYFGGNISRYEYTGKIDYDIIKEYSLAGFRFYRQTAVPYGFIQLPSFKLYPGESFDLELYFKSHGSNDNQLCFEIEVEEEGLTPSNLRSWRFSNFKADNGDGIEEYSTRQNGYSANWICKHKYGTGSSYAHVAFQNNDDAVVYSERAKYMVESINTNFEEGNFDYQKYTLSVPAIYIPYNKPFYTTGGVTYYTNQKLKPANCTIRIYSMATYQDGNIAVNSSISVGGFDIRKKSDRVYASDNCKVEANETCDYSPATIDLAFVDDPLSNNYTHRIGEGSQYWRRANRNENKALFEILAEDRFNLRVHDIPNIEGDFMYFSGFPIWDRFKFNQYPNARYIPWDVTLNFQQKTCKGLFVPIVDVDTDHKVTFYNKNQNDKEVVYLRKNITIDG